MKRLYKIIVLSIMLLSCKKDIIKDDSNLIPFDTIKPLSYYPVYPGSYWTYLTTYRHYVFDDVNNVYVITSVDSAIVTDTSATRYMLNSYIMGWDNKNQQIRSDSVFVPFFNDEPIYQYSTLKEIMNGAVPPFYGKYKFFSKSVGDTFPTSYNKSHMTYTGLCLKVISKYSTNGNDSIVYLRGSYYGNSHNYETEKFLYKKDVGLIFHARYSPILQDTFYRKELLDFKVNNK
jgi:hypothetical protein